MGQIDCDDMIYFQTKKTNEQTNERNKRTKIIQKKWKKVFENENGHQCGWADVVSYWGAICVPQDVPNRIFGQQQGTRLTSFRLAGMRSTLFLLYWSIQCTSMGASFVILIGYLVSFSVIYCFAHIK